MNLYYTKLKMSTSCHPQTDCALEMMKRMTENYLRCNVSHHQNEWDELLLAAEFVYNSAVNENFVMSLFETDIGYNAKSQSNLLCGAENNCRQRWSIQEKAEMLF